MIRPLLSVLSCVVLAALPVEAREWRGNEVPAYTVEREVAPGIELRAYPEMVMAAVTVEGRRERATGAAFRELAGYIFGGNAAGESIAMTSPVMSKPATMMQFAGRPVMDTRSPESSTTWTQAFVLPSRYDLSDLPAPDNDRVRVFRVAPYRVASIAFLGAGTRSNYEEARGVLARTLAEEGIAHAPVPEYAGYDAPWVPASQQRHEVHFRLLE